MNTQTVFTNARIVLQDEVVHGSVCIQRETITDIDTSGSRAPGAIDLGGDYLMPGLIELHTDNLEKHFTPRPGVKWPELPAIFGHDAVVASAGITTVFNAVATGNVIPDSTRSERFDHMVGAVKQAAASNLTRAEHLLHIRCELTCDATLEKFRKWIDEPLLKLVSVMDHSPGQRQFVNLDKYREYYKGKYNLNDGEMERLIEHHTDISQKFGRMHRSEIAALCRARDVAMASHDDATAAHVLESLEDGMSIAEFPTTVEAARACREHGLHVMMGSPNVVRGFSHSGNVSARDLAAQGLLDTLSSDYVPESLLHSAFILAAHVDHIELPEAVNMISRNPADAAGLHDRGQIAVGKRADLVRVHHDPAHPEHVPVVRGVWRGGRRVA
jgi:alpha-D-ribose 1-methylphosphonate 5-triphosphate diphosphatase